jgi:hypothetical protein
LNKKLYRQGREKKQRRGAKKEEKKEAGLRAAKARTRHQDPKKICPIPSPPFLLLLVQ